MQSVLLVDVQELSIQVGSQEILTQVSFGVRAQEIVTVMGPNGAGKSTLLKAVLGLIHPCHGIIKRKPKIRIGYMPQHLRIDAIIPITVERFLELVSAFSAAWKITILEELKITHLLKKSIHDLSGGETQRVILARALLSKPELLVLDEPVQGIDLSGQAELYRLLSAIRGKYHCGILMVSHDLHLVMSETDFVVCLNRHICCAGTPAMVAQNPEFSKLFGIEATGFAVYTHHHNHTHFGESKCP